MARKWIQSAIKNPGALRATAKRMGLIKGDEPLSQSDLQKRWRPTLGRPTTLRCSVESGWHRPCVGYAASDK
jgi:uncharacterized protein YbjT (DUF2867 family)